MSDRDRMMDLVKQGEERTPCSGNKNINCTGVKCVDCVRESIADNLIANGVTVQGVPETNVGEWISVKDRLPEENERVLACYINPLRKDRPPRMMVGEGTSTQIVKGKVYLWCGGWRSITHWMPLPQPPKGE